MLLLTHPFTPKEISAIEIKLLAPHFAHSVPGPDGYEAVDRDCDGFADVVVDGMCRRSAGNWKKDGYRYHHGMLTDILFLPLPHLTAGSQSHTHQPGQVLTDWIWKEGSKVLATEGSCYFDFADW